MPDILCYHFVPEFKDKGWEAVLVQAEVIGVRADGTLIVRPVSNNSIVEKLNNAINQGRKYDLPVIDNPLPNIGEGADYKPEHVPVRRTISDGKLWLKTREQQCVPGGYFRVSVK